MIHHVGVVCYDENEILSLLSIIMGPNMVQIAEKEIPMWSCLCRVYRVGDGKTLFETVVPTGPGPIQRRLDEQGQSLHHIAIRVEDILYTCHLLESLGVRLVERDPVVGAMGWLVNFIHPAEYGVLIELVEEPK